MALPTSCCCRRGRSNTEGGAGRVELVTKASVLPPTRGVGPGRGREVAGVGLARHVGVTGGVHGDGVANVAPPPPPRKVEYPRVAPSS